jgi:LPXTG-motif cell wall-anchored protein
MRSSGEPTTPTGPLPKNRIIITGTAVAVDETCPFCEQRLPHTGSSNGSLFAMGVRGLFVAVLSIVVAIFRCVRCVIACALCLVGWLGRCAHVLGMKIAHPDDRKFLPNL